MEAGTEPGMRPRSEIDWHHCSDLDVDLNRDCDFKPHIMLWGESSFSQALILVFLPQPPHHCTRQEREGKIGKNRAPSVLLLNTGVLFYPITVAVLRTPYKEQTPQFS